jgi:tetratricopeptide (TPR) repeat protein
MRSAAPFFLLSAALWATSPLAEPSHPVLSGDYRVPGAGLLTFRTTSTEVAGELKAENGCSALTGARLADGRFEGTTFVGTVSLCFEGSSCPTQGVPFMGVMIDGAVIGYLTAPAGCRAKGVDGKHLVFEPTLETVISIAETLLKASDFETARSQLIRASLTPAGRQSLQVYFYLGAALNGLKKFAEGKDALEQALRLAEATRAPDDLQALVLYNLACAEAGLSARDPAHLDPAMRHLKKAVGPRNDRFREELVSDADLAPLRGLADFQKLVGAKKGSR